MLESHMWLHAYTILQRKNIKRRQKHVIKHLQITLFQQKTVSVHLIIIRKLLRHVLEVYQIIVLQQRHVIKVCQIILQQQRHVIEVLQITVYIHLVVEERYLTIQQRQRHVIEVYQIIRNKYISVMLEEYQIIRKPLRHVTEVLVLIMKHCICVIDLLLLMDSHHQMLQIKHLVQLDHRLHVMLQIMVRAMYPDVPLQLIRVHQEVH